MFVQKKHQCTTIEVILFVNINNWTFFSLAGDLLMVVFGSVVGWGMIVIVSHFSMWILDIVEIT